MAVFVHTPCEVRNATPLKLTFGGPPSGRLAASQLPVGHRHKAIDNPTLADAILDRLHQAAVRHLPPDAPTQLIAILTVKLGDCHRNARMVAYETELWQMADALRGSMDAAEYKHVVLGLIFLKYISDAFEERYLHLEGQRSEGADPEDPDEYRAQNVFWVPLEARWANLRSKARQPAIGQVVDVAMERVERDNPILKGILPKDYARPVLNQRKLGQLIDVISNIQIGGQEAHSRDVLGRVYEYFLSRFASAEGKKGGEFYTPRCIVRLLVEMLQPFRGRVYDPCCGSSGMFVQSVEFIRAHARGNGGGGRAGIFRSSGRSPTTQPGDWLR